MEVRSLRNKSVITTMIPNRLSYQQRPPSDLARLTALVSCSRGQVWPKNLMVSTEPRLRPKQKQVSIIHGPKICKWGDCGEQYILQLAGVRLVLPTVAVPQETSPAVIAGMELQVKSHLWPLSLIHPSGASQ